MDDSSLPLVNQNSKELLAEEPEQLAITKSLIESLEVDNNRKDELLAPQAQVANRRTMEFISEKPEPASRCGVNDTNNNNSSNNNNDERSIVSLAVGSVFVESPNGGNRDFSRPMSDATTNEEPLVVDGGRQGTHDGNASQELHGELLGIMSSNKEADTLTSISSRRTDACKEDSRHRNKPMASLLHSSESSRAKFYLQRQLDERNQKFRSNSNPIQATMTTQFNMHTSGDPSSQTGDLDSDGHSARSSSASSCDSETLMMAARIAATGKSMHRRQQVAAASMVVPREPEKSGAIYSPSTSETCTATTTTTTTTDENKNEETDPKVRLLNALNQLTRKRDELKTYDRQLVEIIDNYLVQLNTYQPPEANPTNQNIMDLSKGSGGSSISSSSSNKSPSPSFNLKKSRLLGTREANTFIKGKEQEEKVIHLEPKEQSISTLPSASTPSTGVSSSEPCAPLANKLLYWSHEIEQNQTLGEEPVSPVKRFKSESSSWDLRAPISRQQHYHTFDPFDLQFAAAAAQRNMGYPPVQQLTIATTSSTSHQPLEPTIMDMFRFQQHHLMTQQTDHSQQRANLNPLLSTPSMGHFYHQQHQHLQQQPHLNHSQVSGPQEMIPQQHNMSFASMTNHSHNQHQQQQQAQNQHQQKLQKMSYRCHVCGSGFEDRHRLQQHLSIHLNLHPSWFEEKTIKETMAQYESRRGDYLCQVCSLRYETTAEFDKHMQLHGDKPHQCELCSQDNNRMVSFRYYRQLLTHLRSHCFLYSCKFTPECKQTANRKDYLKLHILKHHLNNKLPEQYTICCH